MPAIETPLFRLAHISDLHFFKLQWNPLQLFSKRWLGNLNLLFHRKNALEPEALTTLFPVFHERKVDAVLITGDLTTTTHEDELLLAKRFVDCLKGENLKVFTLPGNHDHYTKKAFRKKSFYQFFDEAYAPGLSLKQDQLTAAHFGHGWWLMALDTAVATSWVSSTGYFSPELEQRLEKALQEIPDDHRVILLNHFPIFSNESPRKRLIRKEALKKLIERFPKIKLFLHGHTHRHSVADLRSSGLPIILDSGSTAKKQGGTWNLIDITPSGCEVEVFNNSGKDDFWQSVSKTGFKWQ
jgi:3',5'-cyclic AMP phosphodiesterase CpdA